MSGPTRASWPRLETPRASGTSRMASASCFQFVSGDTIGVCHGDDITEIRSKQNKAAGMHVPRTQGLWLMGPLGLAQEVTVESPAALLEGAVSSFTLISLECRIN